MPLLGIALLNPIDIARVVTLDPMLLRAAVVWLAILALASLNGAVRDLVVAPRIGDTAARALSTLVLSGLVLLVTWLSIRWVGPRSARQARAVGLFWLVLTLAFEVGAGRLSGRTWAVVLADYDVLRGRTWVLVPIVTFFAPLWLGRARRLWPVRRLEIHLIPPR